MTLDELVDFIGAIDVDNRVTVVLTVWALIKIPICLTLVLRVNRLKIDADHFGVKRCSVSDP